MVMKLTDKLKDIYKLYKDEKNPPVPIKEIKEYLKLSGVELEEDDTF
jgi:ABC-type uncharacterized transport system substrate-binding protein